MKTKSFITAALMSTVLTTWASTTISIEGTMNEATNPLINYVGRVRFTPEGWASFNYPGTEINADFEGTSLRMSASPMSGFFMVEVDGCKGFKVSFNSQTDSVVSLATALAPGRHSVRIAYCIEGLNRKPEFRGLITDHGCGLLKQQNTRTRKIEFIGNSITCGYGVESSEKTDPFEEATENHYYTYASIVSRSLNAEHTSISRSGIGAYRNYDGPKDGSPDPMPWQYPYTLFNDHSERWDFSKYQPHLVCINIGTNDFSTDNYDARKYEKAYREFLSQVRGYYPDAKIVLLTGPMLREKENNKQKSILDDIANDFNKKGDANIYRFDFTPQTGELGYGASWHPSMRQQQRMAEELTPYLKSLMNW